MRALSEHLLSCASCRQVEATYRQVGESVRLLPTITPDASFRDRVFAAIAQERVRLGPAALLASRATTEPSLPVVRSPIPLTSAHRRLGPVQVAALAAAAVLLISLIAMQWVSGLNAANIAANISRQTNPATLQSRLSSYLPDQQFFQVTDVQATHDWLAYVAGNGSGSTMLFVVDRHNSSTHAIFASPATGHVTLVALTPHWVTWSVTSDAGWAVSSAPLKGGDAWRARPLMQSATSALTGAWADDSEALIATSAGGEATLQRMSLAASATTSVVIASGSHQGAIITSPSLDAGVVYWADVWSDSQGSLHSAIWSETVTGVNPVTQAGGEAYSPVAANGALVWINAAHALTVDSGAGAAKIAAVAAQASGKLLALTIANGHIATLASEAPAASVRIGGGTALWSAGSAMLGYNFTTGKALAENNLLTHAQIADASSDAISWFDGSHIAVYALK